MSTDLPGVIQARARVNRLRELAPRVAAATAALALLLAVAVLAIDAVVDIRLPRRMVLPVAAALLALALPWFVLTCMRVVAGLRLADALRSQRAIRLHDLAQRLRTRSHPADSRKDSPTS
jgi:protein-S-isoprenylcysteine O-methyltransferase Ste14